MLKPLLFRLFIITAVAAGVAACDDEPPTSPNNSRDPVTETFSGNVAPNGAQTHTFTTATSGTVTATLKEVAPDSTLAVGFSLGNWNGTSCQLVFARDDATTGFAFTATASAAGTFCVRVQTAETIGTTVRYTVEVVYP